MWPSECRVCSPKLIGEAQMGTWPVPPEAFKWPQNGLHDSALTGTSQCFWFYFIFKKKLILNKFGAFNLYKLCFFILLFEGQTRTELKPVQRQKIFDVREKKICRVAWKWTKTWICSDFQGVASWIFYPRDLSLVANSGYLPRKVLQNHVFVIPRNFAKKKFIFWKNFFAKRTKGKKIDKKIFRPKMAKTCVWKALGWIFFCPGFPSQSRLCPTPLPL